MLRFFVPLIAVLTYALAANIDECTLGESYWCSSVENAKTCGAFEHCKSTVWQNEILKPFSPLRIHSEPICTDCKKFFTDIKNLILTNATEAKIEELVDLVLCRSFGQKCRDLVKQYLPEILQRLFSDPIVVCQSLGCCTKTKPETRTFLMKLKLKKSEFYQIAAADVVYSSAEGCNICKSILKDILDVERNQATQAEIKDFVRKEVCDHLGNLRTSCLILADVYGDKLFKLLSNELDPESRCRSLGFCSADNVIRDPAREAAPNRENRNLNL